MPGAPAPQCTQRQSPIEELEEPQPPQYRCPICGGEMEKHGYREYITLSPVEDREPANGPPPTNVKT